MRRLVDADKSLPERTARRCAATDLIDRLRHHATQPSSSLALSAEERWERWQLLPASAVEIAKPLAPKITPTLAFASSLHRVFHNEFSTAGTSICLLVTFVEPEPTDEDLPPEEEEAARTIRDRFVHRVPDM